MCLQDADVWARLCMCMTSRMSVWGHTRVSVCVCVWLSGCRVRYASDSEPVGIRKVDLGHKYLISVCCPWKSSIYSWPNGKTRLGNPPSLIDKKEIQHREAARGTLTWCGWRRKEATPVGEEKNKMFISCWWKVITRKPQMDSFQKPSHCLFGLKRTVIWYKKKSYHRQQNIGYYVFETVLLSNRIYTNLKMLA